MAWQHYIKICADVCAVQVLAADVCVTSNCIAVCTVQCSLPDANSSVVDSSLFGRVWRQTFSVPLFLVVILFPLINLKSPTYFTKLNALGTLIRVNTFGLDYVNT